MIKIKALSILLKLFRRSNSAAIITAAFLSACSTLPSIEGPSTEPESQAGEDAEFRFLDAVTDYPLVAVYFGEGEHAGFHLAASYDGYNWAEITQAHNVSFNPKIGPWETFRDPSFDRGPDGTFHMTWTCGNNGFCYANSKDLVNWSSPRFIKVNKGPLSKKPLMMTWAPEVFYDADRGEFIVCFASADTHMPNLQTRFKGNFQSFYVLTKDFQSFSDPALLLQPHPEMFEIDPALIKHDGKYFAFVKIESSNTFDGGKDGIHYASADRLEGPWSKLSGTKLPANQNNSEGPSPLKLGKEIIVYYDRPDALQAAKTKNLRAWKDVTHKISPPRGFRHGTFRQLNPLPSKEQLLSMLNDNK